MLTCSRVTSIVTLHSIRQYELTWRFLIEPRSGIVRLGFASYLFFLFCRKSVNFKCFCEKMLYFVCLRNNLFSQNKVFFLVHCVDIVSLSHPFLVVFNIFFTWTNSFFCIFLVRPLPSPCWHCARYVSHGLAPGSTFGFLRLQELIACAELHSETGDKRQRSVCTHFCVVALPYKK